MLFRVLLSFVLFDAGLAAPCGAKHRFAGAFPWPGPVGLHFKLGPIGDWPT